MNSSDQHNSARAVAWSKFLEMKGPRHLVDAATPALGFLVGYKLFSAEVGIVVAVVVALALAALRLAKGDSVKVVALSVATVLVFSLFVQFTGEGRAFYLPDLIICALGAILFGVTLLTPKPLSLWVCQRLGLEPAVATASHRRLHRRITLAWFVFWLIHLLVMVPLYAADKVVVLGTVALILGKPLLIAMIIVTWLWVRRAEHQPTPMPGRVSG